MVDENLEVRRIEPAKLSEQHIGKRVLCHRPLARLTRS